MRAPWSWCSTSSTIDGAKALSKVIRHTFSPHTPIQRCQLHKARNVIERLPKPLHASVRRALRREPQIILKTTSEAFTSSHGAIIPRKVSRLDIEVTRK
jgi:transposase-like protein